MLYAIGILMILGFLFGAGLAFASRVLAVKRDERIEMIEEALPGVNCGACGFGGCSGFAEAAVRGDASPGGCPVGGLEVAQEIARILGQEIETSDAREVAIVRCRGTSEAAAERFEYVGEPDCDAAHAVAGGHKVCEYGCLGLGNCVRVCPFDAIFMGDDGLPLVDEEKCTACGNCVEACPRDIIALMPEGLPVYVMCVSHDGPRESRKACKNACIACGLCVRKFPDSYTLEDNLARIDYENCEGCEGAIEVCPTGALQPPRGGVLPIEEEAGS